ncbi:MAG: cytochrome c biogenesis protein CcdA [Thermomicrobiales bacterium]|nr:cytochrome c biogenesis protein CcdA [Thermomicrobiales bacterium]
MGDVSFLAAFVAGVLSITSPCVLPLIPIYIAHIAGVSAGESEATAKAVIMRNALAYVAGFSLVFIALGAAFGAAGAIAGSLDFVRTNVDWLVRIGGVLLMVLGLHMLGVFRIPFLYRDAHMQLDGGKPGTIGSSFVIGVSFGAGWTPCMGPILGVILTLAASQGDTVRATWLLVVYSLGLAIPFLGAALAFGSLPGLLRKVNKHLVLVETISGAIMIAVGIIMIMGWYQLIFNAIIDHAPWTPWEPDI